MNKMQKLTAFIPNHLHSLSLDQKFHDFLNSELGNEFTTIFTTPAQLIYDDRAQYCCKIKCPNYNTRCYCPPYSLNFQNRISQSKIAIILVKTYDFSTLSYFKKNPEKLNRDYLFKKRVFVRRWVQNDYYGLIKRTLDFFNFDSKVFISSGFSQPRCIKCISKKTENQVKKRKCFPMPSPEAMGIDVKKTLDKFHYYLDFGVKTKMSKVSIFFLQDSELKNISNKYIGKFDCPFSQQFSPIPMNYEFLKNFSHKLQYELIDVDLVKNDLKPDFKWLSNWSKAIIWKLEGTKKNKIKKILHEKIFLNNYYFALDFYAEEIFSGTKDFDGIEFLD